ncbi:MAG: hypothetical protein WD250_14015 [Egibacteraceae bacterium]
MTERPAVQPGDRFIDAAGDAAAVHRVRAILTDLAEQGSSLWGRFNAGRDDQLWHHESLARVAESSHGDSGRARELVRTAGLRPQADA